MEGYINVGLGIMIKATPKRILLKLLFDFVVFPILVLLALLIGHLISNKGKLE